MKLNKKIGVLALAGAMLTLTVCGAQAAGLKDGMKNGSVAGLKSGMADGLKNGLVNGFINGDIQQVLDIETLNRMLENGDLTQEEYDALIAAPESEE